MTFFAAMTSNNTTTENGALCYQSTKDARLDAFAKLVRGIVPSEVEKLFNAIYAQAERAAGVNASQIAADLVLLWVSTRAVRDGKGERRISHEWFCHVALRFPKTSRALIDMVPDFGCWRDIFDMMKMQQLPGHAREAMLQLVVQTAESEQAKLQAETFDGLSLFGKWAPRPKSANYSLANEIAARLYPGANDACARYRQLIAELNRRIKTSEVLMSSGRWREIEPARVPARCLTDNRNAFMNLQQDKKTRRSGDPDRIQCAANFTAALDNGKALHGRSQHPHEIVKHFMHGSPPDRILEGQWADLTTRLGQEYPNLGNLVVLSDVSASMCGTPMEVSVTFGILGATLGRHRGHFMTFESNPRWVHVPGSMSLQEKVAHTMRAPWGGSTDLMKAMELMLTACRDHQVPSSEVAELKLLIVSDMQFNCAVAPATMWETTFEHIQRRFKESGYSQVPLIIFWNVRAASGFAAPADVAGVIQLAGFSPNLLKTVMDGNLDKLSTPLAPAPTSLDVMRAALDDPAYEPVHQLCGQIQEGLMAGYKLPAVAVE